MSRTSSRESSSIAGLLLPLLLLVACAQEATKPGAQPAADSKLAGDMSANSGQSPSVQQNMSAVVSPADGNDSERQDPPCFDRTAWRKTFEYGPEGLVKIAKGFSRASSGTPVLIYEMRFVDVNTEKKGYQYDCYPHGPSATVAESRGEYTITTYVLPFNDWKMILYYPVDFSELKSTNIKYDLVTLPNGGVTREFLNEETLQSLDTPTQVHRFRAIYHRSASEPYLMSIEAIP